MSDYSELTYAIKRYRDLLRDADKFINECRARRNLHNGVKKDGTRRVAANLNGGDTLTPDMLTEIIDDLNNNELGVTFKEVK